ncbi:CHAT domain-containing protein [Aeromonas hydrophila]|uniref:CHAT domain-containing protein n=1 Tax=Aeromonas hydrophila TaxID=644 RepID=UPI002B468275|nr:CHAT domain-containing protein [Aeromonas hydrophila]
MQKLFDRIFQLVRNLGKDGNVSLSSPIVQRFDSISGISELNSCLSLMESEARDKAADPYWTTFGPGGSAYNVGSETLRMTAVVRRLFRSIGISTSQSNLSLDYLPSLLLASKLVYESTYEDPDGFAAAGFNQLLQFIDGKYSLHPKTIEQLSNEAKFNMESLIAHLAEPSIFSERENIDILWNVVLKENRFPLSAATRAVSGPSRNHICSLQILISAVITYHENCPELLLKAYACALALRDGIDIGDTDSLASYIDSMKPGTQIVEYFIYRDELSRYTRGEFGLHYIAFAFDCGNWRSIRFKLCLSGVNENNREIADYRAHMTGKAEVESRAKGIEPILNFSIISDSTELSHDYFCQLKGGRVYQSLVAGLLSDCERVIVTPVGDILRLPFESLPDGAYTSFLGLQHAFIYQLVSPVITRLINSIDNTNKPSKYSLVFGGCDFDLELSSESDSKYTIPCRDSLFEPLPASLDEATAIAAMLGGLVLSGPEAVKTKLQGVVSPKVMHFATHAFNLDREHHSAPEIGELGTKYIEPQRMGYIYAGIALSGVNEQICEGGEIKVHSNSILQPADILSLNLSGTKLVTISACDSGLGPTELQDGPLGLRDSFIAAGASTVVSSFWEVPDDHTASFMKTFYSELVSGVCVSNALLAARRAHSGKPVQVWAAFGAVGRDVIL